MLISHCTYLDGSFIVLQIKYKHQKIEGNDRERLIKLEAGLITNGILGMIR
jgi:tetrahydromethanopterin S-methyltransferase subunit F